MLKLSLLVCMMSIKLNIGNTILKTDILLILSLGFLIVFDNIIKLNSPSEACCVLLCLTCMDNYVIIPCFRTLQNNNI